MEISIFHTDHNVSEAAIRWALETIREGAGFFAKTFLLPDAFADLSNALHGPACGDPPVPEAEVFYAQRSPDRPPSRLCKRAPRKSRLLTVIGIRAAAGGASLIFTAYGGPMAAREPGDPNLTTPEEIEEARAFWAAHALSEPAPQAATAPPEPTPTEEHPEPASRPGGAWLWPSTRSHTPAAARCSMTFGATATIATAASPG